jgi:predicted RecB family nuclease
VIDCCSRPAIYEAWDTKLARRTKPAYVFQLAFYSAQIARITGQHPELLGVIPGTNDTERLRTDDFFSYCRAVRSRFQRFVAEGP